MLQNQGRWNQLCQLLQESLEEKGKEKGEKKKGYSRIRPCNKNYRLRLQWLCGGIAKDTPPISQRRFAHSPKLSDFSFSEG